MSWTAEKINRALALWQSGWPGDKIASELKTPAHPLTRTAVIAKINREYRKRGWPLKGGNGRGQHKMRVSKDVKKAPSEPVKLPPLFYKIEKTGKASNGAVTVNTLKRHHCKFPIGDPKKEGFHFCGKRRLYGQAYCASCITERKLYQPGSSYFTKRKQYLHDRQEQKKIEAYAG